VRWPHRFPRDGFSQRKTDFRYHEKNTCRPNLEVAPILTPAPSPRQRRRRRRQTESLRFPPAKVILALPAVQRTRSPAGLLERGSAKRFADSGLPYEVIIVATATPRRHGRKNRFRNVVQNAPLHSSNRRSKPGASVGRIRGRFERPVDRAGGSVDISHLRTPRQHATAGIDHRMVQSVTKVAIA